MSYTSAPCEFKRVQRDRLGLHMFTSGDALRKGWMLFRENAGFLIGVHLFLFAIYTPQAVSEWFFPDSDVTKLLIVFATMILSYVVSIGLIRIVIQLVDGEEITFASLFAGAHLVFRFVLASILYGLLVLVGFVLLVVPGILWGVQFSLWGFYMVEHEMGPIESFRASSRATAGHRFRLTGFYIICIGLFLAGVVSLLVGILVVWPVTSIASAWIYRVLDREAVAAAA